MRRGWPGQGGEGVCSGQRQRMCKGPGGGSRVGRWRIGRVPFDRSPSLGCAGGAGEGRLEGLAARLSPEQFSVWEFLWPKQLRPGCRTLSQR